MEKIFPISLKLNFNPNNFGGYGLKCITMGSVRSSYLPFQIQ